MKLNFFTWDINADYSAKNRNPLATLSVENHNLCLDSVKTAKQVLGPLPKTEQNYLQIYKRKEMER